MIPFLEMRFSTNQSEADDLSSAFLALKTPAAVRAFLSDLCTRQEIQMLNERWAIAKLIQMGFPYRIINEKTGASSATISRISRSLTQGSGELRNACKRRQAEVIHRNID